MLQHFQYKRISKTPSFLWLAMWLIKEAAGKRVRGPYLLPRACITRRRLATEVQSSVRPPFCWWSLWGQQSLLVSWIIQIYFISGLFFLVLFHKSKFKTLGLTFPSFPRGWHICCLAGNLGDFCRHFKWWRLYMWEEKFDTCKER